MPSRPMQSSSKKRGRRGRRLLWDLLPLGLALLFLWVWAYDVAGVRTFAGEWFIGRLVDDLRGLSTPPTPANPLH